MTSPHGHRVIARQIARLAAPTMGIALLQAAGQLAETVLAARQGTAALAGWALVLPFVLLMQQMSAGAMGGGVVSAIARALGAGRAREASALVLHALLIALGLGLAFTVALAGFPRAVLGAIGGPAPAEAAAAYAAWLFGAGAVPAWLANTLASVLRGGGRHGLAAAVLMLQALGFPPLAWLLMEPAGLGLPGLGMAFAATQLAAALAMAAVVARGGAGFLPALRQAPAGRAVPPHPGRPARSPAPWRPSPTSPPSWSPPASPPAAPAAVAAYGISARLEFLMVPLAFGVGSALTALVGRAVGAGDWATARRIAWVGGAAATAVAASIGLATGLFPSTSPPSSPPTRR